MSPRGRRRFLEHRTYHVTHRCYNREFRLKFALDRNRYRLRLFEMTKSYNVKVLDYVITSNHVHLLLWSDTAETLSEGMRFLQGSFAQDYNRRKKRSGAFWSGRFHATLIQDGIHLGRCLFYIGLNMVRNKVVRHPSEWEWSGYHELVGTRQRYRIVDLDSLFRKLSMTNTPHEDFVNWYEETLTSKISTNDLKREGFWSESVAVGDKEWLATISGGIPQGRFQISPVEYGELPREKSIPLELNEQRSAYVLSTSRRGASVISRRY